MTGSADNTYSFLQKKLADANETITSYSLQEANFKCDIERLIYENEDLVKQITSLKAEVNTSWNKYVTADQKLQGEMRTRYLLQETLKEKDTEILEERKRSKKYENYLKELQAKVTGYENELEKFQEFVKTSFRCKDSLVQNTKELNEVLEKSKTVINVLKTDKSDLSNKLASLETDFESYETNYEDLAAEVELLKDESAKQETYIKVILDSFKELDMHFRNIKTYYHQQKAKVDASQKEFVQKSSKEEFNEMEKYKKGVQEK